MLRSTGVRLQVCGDVARLSGPGRGVLVVSNHISWLDIFALGAVWSLRFVGRFDVVDWPILGALARARGFIPADRERLSALPALVARVEDALRSGSAVGAFPEGTTWCGAAGGRFGSALFQAALDAGAPVLPVALRYRLADGRPTTAPAFVRDVRILDSLHRIAGVRGLVIEVHPLRELSSREPCDRRELCARAESAVDAVRFVADPGSGCGTHRPEPTPAGWRG